MLLCSRGAFIVRTFNHKCCNPSSNRDTYGYSDSSKKNRNEFLCEYLRVNDVSKGIMQFKEPKE